MKLLIDNALSYQLAEQLRSEGADAVHVRDMIPVDSPDEVVFECARKENRILVSADTDFGAILANRAERQPSFILLRHDAPVLPEEQANLLKRILAMATTELDSGCIVSAHREKIRIRQLPLR